jgi:uncharacterized protein (UPF0264 family)
MTPTPPSTAPGLLVSVRSAVEARAALAGGATVIDVKEPDHGALGRAAAAVIAGVVAAVAGCRPVSAALGELTESDDEPLPLGLSFVKWGLAGCGTDPAWRAALRARHGGGPAVVTVGYADWQCARAPSVDEVLAFALERPGGVLLIDTHCKEPARPGGLRPTLLDWLSVAELESLCAQCRERGVHVALAGSLGPEEMRRLAGARPDWFAVRGAACDDGRHGTVSAARVRALVALIRACCPRNAD